MAEGYGLEQLVMLCRKLETDAQMPSDSEQACGDPVVLACTPDIENIAECGDDVTCDSVVLTPTPAFEESVSSQHHEEADTTVCNFYMISLQVFKFFSQLQYNKAYYKI